MTTAREMMHFGAECIAEDKTLAEAAQMMRDQHVGSLPICGKDDKLHGIITDRDIVTKCIAAGHDPSDVTAGQLASDRLIWIDSEADDAAVSKLMRDNKIRRLPVIENGRVVGMISESDMAQHLDDVELTTYVQEVYAAPPNN